MQVFEKQRLTENWNIKPTDLIQKSVELKKIEVDSQEIQKIKEHSTTLKNLVEFDKIYA